MSPGVTFSNEKLKALADLLNPEFQVQIVIDHYTAPAHGALVLIPIVGSDSL